MSFPSLSWIRSISPQSMPYISGLAFSPNSKAIAIAGDTGSYNQTAGVVQWWTTSGTLTNLKSVQTGTVSTSSLCYSAGGGFLFVGTEQSVQIYSTVNYGLTTSYGQETTGVTSIAMSPGGATFAYARTDGTIVMANNPNAAADIRASIVVSPGTIIGGDSALATITLSAPAPKGGISCRLSGSGPVIVTDVSSVMIQEGNTTATVAIHSRRVASRESATVSVTVPAGESSADLVVKP